MTRYSNIPRHTKKAIKKHKCTIQKSPADTHIILSQDNNAAIAECFLGLKKHSRKCLAANINVFERMFGWSLFRLIMVCAVNDIPFIRDFTPPAHAGCINQMNCYSCILYYEYNFLFTGFRKSSNRFLLSIIKKIDKFYRTFHPLRAMTFVDTVFNMSIAYTNIYIFEILLHHYNDFMTIGHINNIIRAIYEKREIIGIDFLTVCLYSLAKHVSKNKRLKDDLKNVPVERFNITAGLWREIVELRFPSCRNIINNETGLPIVLIDIINDYNYIDPDIRSYL